MAISETAPVLDFKEIFFWKQKDNKKNIYNYIILYICSYIPNVKKRYEHKVYIRKYNLMYKFCSAYIVVVRTNKRTEEVAQSYD